MKLDHTNPGEQKVKRSSGRKKRDGERKRKVEPAESDLVGVQFEDEAYGGTQKRKLSRKRKAKKDIAIEHEGEKADIVTHEVGVDLSDQDATQESAETKNERMKRKRRKDEKTKKARHDKPGEVQKESEDGDEKAKLKDTRKKKKKSRISSRNDEKVLEQKAVPEQDDVYEMSSGDEDCSRGMKKWITEYHQSRPGLKVLQDQIDDFITAHEEKEEEARKEKEAQAAEGGWTVVVHHKGRKKTTEAESGTVVGSVAPAAVLENMAKKKNKQIGPDFYRFQKREAQMSELMQLQSKFEQDKKRIQQMRAARKFRPY